MPTSLSERSPPPAGSQALLQPKSRVFLALVLASLLGAAPLFIGCFSILLGAVSAEFGWGRGQLSIAFGLSGLAAAFASPLLGKLIDRIGPRYAIAIGMLGFGASLAALSRLPASQWMFSLVFVCIAVFGGLGGPLVGLKLIGTWFTSNRGLMIGLFLGLATGPAIAIASPLVGWLVQQQGWRTAYLVLGCAVVLMLPLVLLVLPKSAPPLDEGGTSAGPAAQAGPAMSRARLLPMLMVAMLISAIATGGLSAHVVTLFEDKGATSSSGALALSLLSIIAFAGQLGIGALVDRASSPRPLIAVLAMGFAGLLLLSHAPGGMAAWLFVGVALVGPGVNLALAGGAPLISRYYGADAAGAMQGALLGMAGLGAAAGPGLLGVGFDRLGSYDPVLTTLGLLLLLPMALVLMMPRFPPR